MMSIQCCLLTEEVEVSASIFVEGRNRRRTQGYDLGSLQSLMTLSLHFPENFHSL